MVIWGMVYHRDNVYIVTENHHVHRQANYKWAISHSYVKVLEGNIHEGLTISR